MRRRLRRISMTLPRVSERGLNHRRMHPIRLRHVCAGGHLLIWWLSRGRCAWRRLLLDVPACCCCCRIRVHARLHMLQSAHPLASTLSL